jgi:hypothetical protein
MCEAASGRSKSNLNLSRLYIGQNPKDRDAERRLHRQREARRLRQIRGTLKRTKERTFSYVGSRRPATDSSLLPLFVAEARDLDRRAGRPNRTEISCPETFSFINAPDDALDVAYRFAEAARNRCGVIAINQRRCSSIDLCAVAVLDALALEAQQCLHPDFHLRLPKDARAREIVWSTGLPRVLEPRLPQPKHFLNYELHRGKAVAATGYSPSSDAREAGQFTQWVDKCLRAHNAQLNAQGKNYLCQLVAEALANAQDHSGRGEWWISGYMRKPNAAKGTPVGDVHITLFSFGRTLAETLMDLPAESLLRNHIERLVGKHTAHKTLLGKRLTPENMWTICALQEGVSCRNDQRELLGKRGLGTARMIEMFQRLGATGTLGLAPVMCLHSGHTHLKFDRQARMSLREIGVDGQKRNVIAFNSANDLEQPPETRYVRTTRRKFPGVLISMRFFIDPNYRGNEGAEYVARN